MSFLGIFRRQWDGLIFGLLGALAGVLTDTAGLGITQKTSRNICDAPVFFASLEIASCGKYGCITRRSGQEPSARSRPVRIIFSPSHL